MVEDVYLEILERPADKTGLDHYVARMMNSNDPLNTKEELIVLFNHSDEYENKPLFSLNNINNKVNALESKTKFQNKAAMETELLDLLKSKVNNNSGESTPWAVLASANLDDESFVSYGYDCIRDGSASTIE